MKILLVSSQDYLHHPVPSRHHNLFEILATRHEVHVPHFHVSRGKERPTRLIVHEATRYPGGGPFLHYTMNAPHQFRILEGIVRDCQIDVVVAAHVLAGMGVIRAARKHGVPVVFDLKDWFPDSAAAYYRSGISKWLIRNGVWAVTRYNLSRSDRITTVSPSLVKKLAGHGFPATLITNGVDTELFRPMDGGGARDRLGIPRDAFVLGFAGSVERWYALDRVVEALPALLSHRPDTRLLIVGGSLFTSFSRDLAERAATLGIADRVTFTGPVPYGELPALIAAMDLCLMPLAPPRWVDIALPNKYFEYSACGKPILSTPIPDVMALGGPHLSYYRTNDEMVERILHAMDHPATFQLDLEAHSWKRKAGEMEGLLQSLVG
jgi:glycosyltransferase involved in cell wall biosynthesis